MNFLARDRLLYPRSLVHLELQGTEIKDRATFGWFAKQTCLLQKSIAQLDFFQEMYFEAVLYSPSFDVKICLYLQKERACVKFFSSM